jgi:hypothetical protein
MAVRFSKSFKVAPGAWVRVNAKSASISLGGRGLRYTANSRGRRTTRASLPGAGMPARHASGTRAKAGAHRPAARPAHSAARPGQARNASASMPKPGMFAPRGEKELYQSIRALHSGFQPAVVAARCERIAATNPGQRNAALTLAGLLALGHDRDLAIRSLGQVLASGAEIANDRVLLRYSPVRSLSIHAVNPAATVPVSRDLVAMLLVQLHTAAGQLDRAESAARQLKASPVADALRRELAIRRQRDVDAQPWP